MRGNKMTSTRGRRIVKWILATFVVVLVVPLVPYAFVSDAGSATSVISDRETPRPWEAWTVAENKAVALESDL